MRLLHAAAAFTATSALALTLTACGGDDSVGNASDTPSASSSASTPTSSASASTTAPADNAAATQDSGSSTGGTGTGTGNSRCHTSGLTLSFGSGDGTISSSDDQQQLPVVLKNKSSASCTLQGFPGVDLKPSSGDVWSLTRSSVTGKKVTLAPGGSATFTITYLPWTKGSGTEFKAVSLVVTPPNETSSLTTTWPGGSVLLQDGATHPGTYVGPVGS